jgi:hypothetical protein
VLPEERAGWGGGAAVLWNSVGGVTPVEIADGGGKLTGHIGIPIFELIEIT